MSFEDFVDERLLVSHDALGTKEMKIKVVEVSDETSPSQWKDRGNIMHYWQLVPFYLWGYCLMPQTRLQSSQIE